MDRKSIDRVPQSFKIPLGQAGKLIMKILKDKKGIALFMAIAAMAVFLFFVSASLFLTRIDSKVTSNFKLATQALEVADAGLNHALAMIASGYDFDQELNCGNPKCPLVSNPSFPVGSSFSYTVTAENDPVEAVSYPNDDQNNIILLVSTADGPAKTSKSVKAYVRRSVGQFYPPSPVYINASAATSYDNHFFDDDDGILIIGDDTNANNLLSSADDSAGTAPSIAALTTTSAVVTSALLDEFNGYGGSPAHYIQSGGVNPSIETTVETIDINAVAQKFIDNPSAVKYDGAGLATVTGSSYCPAAPTPCQVCASPGDCSFGTQAAPQITYIKDVSGSASSLKGHFVGYGVLVLEGRVTLGENFKFKGLVIHKRSEADHYLAIEDTARIYGGLFLGPYDGTGPEQDHVKFTIEDFSRIYYSSEALSMVDSNWGGLLPRPARVFGWLDK